MEKIKTKQNSEERLTREAWLDQALEAIAVRGAGWMSIQELVSDLGVTKGSFYWHFENREDFMTALLDAWVQGFTTRVTEYLDKLDVDAKGRLLALMEFVSEHELARLDIAMRAWALKEESVNNAVTKSDVLRANYVRSQFEEMGFRGDELEMRVRTFVIYHCFDAGFSEHEPIEDRRRRLKLRHEWFTRR